MVLLRASVSIFSSIILPFLFNSVQEFTLVLPMANNLMCVFSSLVLIFACFAQSSQAYQFIVGGKDGWVLNPSESYSSWAQRNRFRVNDTLLFRYAKGSDSVLVVNRNDYDSCNIGNPILRLDDGNSTVRFDRSGPFYFISGVKDNCDKGQKLITVVLAIRSPPPPPTTASGPSPIGSPSPSPATKPPSSTSPSPAPQVPGQSPVASSPVANPSTPSAPTPGSPGSPVPGGNSGGGSSPPQGSLAAPACSPKVVVMLAISLVLSLSPGGFVISL